MVRPQPEERNAESIEHHTEGRLVDVRQLDIGIGRGLRRDKWIERKEDRVRSSTSKEGILHRHVLLEHGRQSELGLQRGVVGELVARNGEFCGVARAQRLHQSIQVLSQQEIRPYRLDETIHSCAKFGRGTVRRLYAFDLIGRWRSYQISRWNRFRSQPEVHFLIEILLLE